LTHKETAYAQILLTIIFLGGYFFVLWQFIDGRIHVPAEWKDVLQTLLSVLTASVLQIMSYWFSRQRESTPAGA
jgi:hypothetical protein